MTDRAPAIGDWNNPYDNTIVKHIDIWNVERDDVQNTIAATEYMAELLYAGAWRINAVWLAWWNSEHPPANPGTDPGGPAAGQ